MDMQLERRQAAPAREGQASESGRGGGGVSNLSERGFPQFPSFPFFLPLAFVPLGMCNRCTA